ncbi:hypothetical protein HY256_05760 [Candidatus Sumerlaeota bacterium]|nr:hypothetical protein [Candidatus Sumerlaeota bacterium]
MLGLRDETWTRGRGPQGFQIALASFGILALELAVIRWASSQIRILAYFNNLILIGAFLGMGLGVALGRRRPGIIHWTLPLLLLLAIPFAFSKQLGIMRMSFPDPAVHLWGAESAALNFFHFASSLLVVLGLFTGISLVFLCAGSAIGHLFPQSSPLRAYTFDLTGSFAGILVFTSLTFLGATPPVWLAIGAAPFAWLSRKPLIIIAFCFVVALGWYSIQGAVFSPYNRIDVMREGYSWKLSVNRDFHQFMYDLSDASIMDKSKPKDVLTAYNHFRLAYDLPFVINDNRDRALVVGAGTGNDVKGALRNNYKKVYSVDIDPEIIQKGRELHPEKPYADPRTVPVVNDARAFFEQYKGEPFDAICYGLLDSHAMFSAMSTLRLDNYVYTEEGIRAAWRHVSPKGHLSLSFCVFAGPWISDRLYWTVAKATGIRPVMIEHRMQEGYSYVVAKDPKQLHLDRVAIFATGLPEKDMDHTRTASDDWPFLYVRPGTFPWGYASVLTGVLLLSLIATPLAFGRAAISRDFDAPLFFMGAAFLLIETRGVTTMSLLFGSTWLVNSAIFAGILAMVLAANLAVETFKFSQPLPWFIPLVAGVLLVWGLNGSWLNQFSLLARGMAGGFLTAFPIGAAGIIVSILLARSKNPTASLGSNLLGSVIGGCLEYLSMFAGLRALALLALMLYLLALMFLMRSQSPQTVPTQG